MSELLAILTGLSSNTAFLLVILFTMACIQIFMRPLKDYVWSHWIVSIASMIFYIALIFLAIKYAPLALQYF